MSDDITRLTNLARENGFNAGLFKACDIVMLSDIDPETMRAVVKAILSEVRL